MVQLEDVHQQLLLDIQEGLATIASGARVASISDTFRDLSRHLQALGICHLLEFADRDEFRDNLARSGQARRYYLRKSRDQDNTDDHNLALSRTEAFLDAIAAGDIDLAREIVDLSASSWNADWEYEDDFCYYSFLHDLIQTAGRPDDRRLSAILIRFEGALEGADSPRLQICSALLARDPEGFLDAFEALLNSIRDLNDRKRPLVESYESTFWPRSFVSIEGFALLRIAEMMRITADARQFVLCPVLGRLPRYTGPAAGLFEEIDRGLASNPA